MSLSDAAPVALRLSDYVAPDEAFHLGRRSAGAGFRGTLHTHDFPELLWIESGSLVHLVNGERCSLHEGDLVFIRSDDVHTFRPVAGASFTQVNVAFSQETLDFLGQRYFDGAG